MICIQRFSRIIHKLLDEWSELPSDDNVSELLKQPQSFYILHNSIAKNAVRLKWDWGYQGEHSNANSLDQNCLENLKPNENRCSSILFEACNDDISLATKLTALWGTDATGILGMIFVWAVFTIGVLKGRKSIPIMKGCNFSGTFTPSFVW